MTMTEGVAAVSVDARSVLIVSPYFPPSTLAGVHRARHLAKHLPAHGWHPTIIRVDDAYYTERSDPALAALLPRGVRQIRAGALPISVSKLAGVGDVGLRGYLAIKRAIATGSAGRGPDAILITGSPYYPMLLSRWIKRYLNVPVVLDFQDPWVSAEGATRPVWSKGGMAHALATALEPQALRHATYVTSVSETQNFDMAERYTWLDRTRMAAIPIGGDPDDFVAIRDKPPSSPEVPLDPQRINLSYVGTFLPRAGVIVRTLFRAVRNLRQSHPELARKLQLNFVGTSNQPNCRDVYRVRPIAEEEGIKDLVAETPQRIPFLDALHVLANSRGVLLIGSDEPHYTASKIYPALMSGRPYVSVFHRASSAHSILLAAGGGRAFCFANHDELSSLIPSLTSALIELTAAGIGRYGAVNPDAYRPYTASHVSGRFAEVFEDAIRSADR